MAKEDVLLSKFLDKTRKAIFKAIDDDRLSRSQFPDISNGFNNKDLLFWLLDGNRQIRFPTNIREYYLVQLLGLELRPKLTFKEACDINHPFAERALIVLEIEKNELSPIVENVREHSRDCLAFYQLFESVIDTGAYSNKAIIELVEKIVNDSKYGTVVSHSSKMSNPACRYPRVLSDNCKRQDDGFIRSGNTNVDFDLHIDASKLKVFKFLALPYESKTLFEYLKAGDYEPLRVIFGVTADVASEWYEKLRICITSQDYRTHRLIKQVCFPINNGYHLLSLVQPSGVVFKLKEKVDLINHRSIDTVLGWEAKKHSRFYGNEFRSLLNLTEIKHGGDHPKNISGLNNKFQSCYLLDSSPPFLKPYSIVFPTKDFFIQNLRYYDCKDILKRMNNVFKIDRDSQIPLDKIRKSRDRCLGDIMDMIIRKMIAVRSVSSKQFYPKTSKLPAWQQVWLCEQHTEERLKQDDWLNTLCEHIVRWIFFVYKKAVKNPVLLGEAERQYINEFIEGNKEALK